MRFENNLQGLKNIRVLVLGDIMLDHYIWGDVQRISPEAPVPVVHVNKDTYTAGGAANVALNLSNLGVKTSILGYCNNDDAGDRLSEIFAKNNITEVLKVKDSLVPTIIKTRVIIRGQQLCRIDREASREKYTIENLHGFEELLMSTLSDVDAVIISDYAKGVITQSIINKIINHPKHKNGSLLIAVDPKPSRKLNYHGVDLITPNRNEALELSELPALSQDEPYPLTDICQVIHEKYKPSLLVITLGAEGMAICKNGLITEKLATEARQVFDVSGAGDTVIAVLTACLASGASPVEAATLANIAAGVVVSHMGTAPITLVEFEQAIKHFTSSAG